MQSVKCGLCAAVEGVLTRPVLCVHDATRECVLPHRRSSRVSAVCGANLCKGESMLDDEGAPIQVLEDERAAATLFVGSTTEPSPGAALLACEPDFPRQPLAEEGILIVDAESGTVLETFPFSDQRT